MPSWTQIKVSFDAHHLGFGDDDQLFAWYDRNKYNLPDGWEMNEVYYSPISLIAIFDVDHMPTEKEANIIAKKMKRRKKKPVA